MYPKSFLLVCALLFLEVSGSQRTKQQNKPRTKESQATSPTRPRDEKAAACINQIHPDEEEEASFFRKEIPETEKGKCLLACYLEGKGVMSEGKFNSKGAARVATQAFPNSLTKSGQVKHILSHCGTIASRETDKCLLAYKLADCTTMLSDKFKL
uniref:Odorant-binding protein 13 n=1 Tax=Cyrtorhinus lividipennis TaxID=1032904 RepID=A0A346THZ5_9HEMI|nr:odorant-binding protein 13 [Cyrtorhinus lividipennis]